MNGIAEPPGKVWFWELEAGVIHRTVASSAVPVSPSARRTPSGSMRTPICLSSSRCAPAALSVGTSARVVACATKPCGHPRPSTRMGTPRCSTAQVRSDSSDTYWKISGGPPADGLGAVVDTFAVRAAAEDRRRAGRRARWTALLIGLLAAGEIDGALVSKPSSDPDEQWKGIATIATTAGRSSCHVRQLLQPDDGVGELDLSRYTLPAEPRIAVVGTPCEVQGLRAMQARRWPHGRSPGRCSRPHGSR